MDWLGRRGGTTNNRVETPGILSNEVPDWWPYAAEFPQWHVWRGICGLVYASALPVPARRSLYAGKMPWIS